MSDSLTPELWARHHRALRRVALGLLRDEHAAEDAAQTTWLRALELRPARTTPAWLRRVVANRARDELRRRAVRASEPLADAQRDPARGPDELAQELELAGRLSAALATLREPYRATLYQRYFEERTPAEIAARAGVPVASVKTRLRRGLALLREALEGDGHGREVLPGLALLARLPGAPEAALPLAPLTLALAMKKLVTLVVTAAALLGLAWVLTGELRRDAPAPAAPAALAPAAAELAQRGHEPPIGAPAAEERAALDAPPANVAPPAALAELLVRLAWADGTPADGCAVGLMVARGGRYEALAREIAAADGEVHFAALEPGDYVVRCDRDAERELALSAGEHAVVELALPRGVDVVGRVVDAAGDAVPGADVWLCASLPSWLAGAVVARADATGAFRLRDVPAETSVGALAAGFAPSPLQDLELVDTQDGVKPVRLVLTRGGATLSGLVLDPDGAPVAGARIAVDRHVPYLDMRQNGTRVERWSPRVARTDADGRFRFEGLRAEPLPLEVHAQGYAVVHEELALEELRTLEHVVRLARPVYARGTVRDDAGAPLAGIELRGFDHAQEPDFLGGGQYDHSGVFGYALTRSAADGRYRLGPLAPGEVHLYAQEPQPRSYYGVSLKLDQHHVAATPGEELAWDPVIGPGLALTGRALYADASPLQDIFVSAVDESSGARRSMTTDAEGRFAFYNLDDRTYTLSAQLWDAPPGTQRPTRHGVRPNGEEVVLQVDYVPPREARPGSVVVRVDDAGGRAAARAELGVTLNGARGWQLSQPDEEGVFRFEDVEPGRYRAVLWNGELALGAGEWFELGPGEHVDLGTLVTEPGGDVVLALDRDAAGAALEGVVWLSHADELPQASFAFAAGRDTLRLGNLAPGRWSGRLYGPHVVADTFEVTVVAGTDVDARVAVRAGAVVTCVVSWSGAASPERIVLRATRASDGAVAQEREAVRDPGFLVSPLERALLLVPGAYEVTAEASDGRRAARRVDVAPGEELSTREVRLDLE